MQAHQNAMPMASRVRPAGLIVCGLITLWLGYLDLDRRITEADDTAANAGYAADDALRRLDGLL